MCSRAHWSFWIRRALEGTVDKNGRQVTAAGLLQLNGIVQRLGQRGRLEFGSDAAIIGVPESLEKTGDFDNEGETAGEEQHDGCNLIEHGGSGLTDDAKFSKD